MAFIYKQSDNKVIYTGHRWLASPAYLCVWNRATKKVEYIDLSNYSQTIDNTYNVITRFPTLSGRTLPNDFVPSYVGGESQFGWAMGVHSWRVYKSGNGSGYLEQLGADASLRLYCSVSAGNVTSVITIYQDALWSVFPATDYIKIYGYFRVYHNDSYDSSYKSRIYLDSWTAPTILESTGREGLKTRTNFGISTSQHQSCSIITTTELYGAISCYAQADLQRVEFWTGGTLVGDPTVITNYSGGTLVYTVEIGPLKVYGPNDKYTPPHQIF